MCILEHRVHIYNYNTMQILYFLAGPMCNTLEDFWRMMWEQRIPTIVMLTRVFEGRVCAIMCREAWNQKCFSLNQFFT